MLHTYQNVQPIDHVKARIEKYLPNMYFSGIVMVYLSSAAVMGLLLYPSFYTIIGNKFGALCASVCVPISIQLMRFLIIFTDSLTAGRNDSKGLVHIVSFAMLIVSILEVWWSVWAIGGAIAIGISVSSLQGAGCILELSFIRKLNRRDEEIEEVKQTAKNGKQVIVQI